MWKMSEKLTLFYKHEGNMWKMSQSSLQYSLTALIIRGKHHGHFQYFVTTDVKCEGRLNIINLTKGASVSLYRKESRVSSLAIFSLFPISRYLIHSPPLFPLNCSPCAVQNFSVWVRPTKYMSTFIAKRLRGRGRTVYRRRRCKGRKVKRRSGFRKK